MAMDIRNYIKTQLNEKVSDTQYDILYPETLAEQVKESETQQFVSQEDKDRWDKGTSDLEGVIETLAKGLLYFGDWVNTTVYPLNAVVQYNGRYYISLKANNSNNTPEENKNTVYWKNINLEAYTSDRADTVLIDNKEDHASTKYLTFVDSTTEGYQAIGVAKIHYQPTTDTLYVEKIVAGNIEGLVTEAEYAQLAEVAKKYEEYQRNTEGDITLDDNGERVVTNTPYIDDALHNINKRIDGITDGSGGAVVANPLIIQKDGKEESRFTGKDPVTLNIKQTYNTTDITDLLNEAKEKIQLKWLPDTIFGQLEYKGTWNPSLVMSGVTAKDGNYWIAVGKPGNYAPDGTLVAETASTVPEFFGVGDWAVYHDGRWDKVDNTDAVTTVNSQRGAVETYKGNWIAETQYFRGDIVKYENKLYICHTTHISATSFQDTNWDLFGRTYSATDGIKIENETIKHDIKLETGETTNITLAADQSFDMPVLTRDSFGHVTKIDIKTIKLGADFVDTTREIQVNGSKILEGTGDNKNKALNFKGSTWIDVKYGNDALNFTHKNNESGAIDLNPEVIDDSTSEDVIYSGTGFSIPQIKVDGAGHIVTAEMKEFKLANSLIKHDHFNITKSADSSQVIGAYGADVADDEWVRDAANKLKFYLGTQNPIRTERMNFNGSFFATKLSQSGNDVLDNTLKIYQGKDYPSASMGETGAAKDLFTQYNTVTKRFEMAKILGFEDSENIVYSAVNVNNRGLVTAGGQIVEFGTQENADPSESLVVGGLFFRRLA